MLTLLTLQQQSDAIHRLLAAHKCHSPRVFGSVSTGTNTVHSDVDLFVELLPDASGLDLVRLELALSEAFGVNFDVYPAPRQKARWKAVVDASIPI